jgi:hypothetical protein
MRTRSARCIVPLFSLLLVAGVMVSTVRANDTEYDAVVKHLKARYQAKKQRIPFLGLARFAVKLVKPAGVKSFDITIFEDLKFDSPERGRDLKSALPGLFTAEWIPLVRMSSINSDQFLVYARETGKDIKLIIVRVEADQATVIRAKIDPETLVKFIQDPKVLGISVSG